jgi:hypothetical protein
VRTAENAVIKNAHFGALRFNVVAKAQRQRRFPPCGQPYQLKAKARRKPFLSCHVIPFFPRACRKMPSAPRVYCPTLEGLKPPPFRRQLQHFFFFTFGSYDAYGNTWSERPSSEIS